MRPIKVTMTAFGPYRDQEIVDFKELNEHRLFVISGSTGAGKTTIFDAICFALYGNASGEDRNDVRMLRSDFADDDVFTSVEFEFELKGRSYRVYRQLAHVKEGNKTATGDRYEFYETTNQKELPLTDRFIVSQVDEKIRDILGLTKEQFSQIVMLPQGEFRKLLTSETENKEEILRRIFKTSFYKTVADHLNNKRKVVQKKFDEQVKEREVYIHQMKGLLPNREGSEWFRVLAQEHYNTFQLVNALEEEVLYYNEEMKKEQLAIKEKSISLQAKQNNYHQAERMNERFKLLDDRKTYRQKLEQKSEQMRDKERLFSLAERASHLEVIEKHLSDTENEVNVKQQAFFSKENNKASSEQALTKAKEIFEQEEKNGPAREKVTLELERLGEFQPIIRELDQKKQELRKVSNQLENLSKNVEKLDRDLMDLQVEKTTISTKVKPLEENVRLLPDKTEKVAAMREQVSILKEYLKTCSTWQEDTKNEATEKEHFEKIDQEFSSLESRWIEGQASVLSAHLHDGKECPVCGSVEHPRKAEKTENVPTKEELEANRLIKRQAEQRFNKVQAKAAASLQLMKERKQVVIDFGFSPEEAKANYVEIAEQGKGLVREIDQLKKDQELVTQLRKAYEELELKITSITKDVNELKNTLNETKLYYQTEKSLYEQRVSNIPVELQSLDQLEKALNDTKLKKKQLDHNWQEAQTVFQSAREHYATSKANYDNAQTQLADIKVKKEEAETAFISAIKNAGFETVEKYLQSKLTVTARDDLKMELEAYNNDLKTVQIQIKDLEQELLEKERSDLQGMKDELVSLEQELEAIRTTYQQAQGFYEKANSGVANIQTADNGVKEVEKQLQLIKDLFDVVRGENTKKISFERYLQIEFLEQIIHAANERLKHLSNGQYFLVRSDRLEKRGKQSGLGLDVLDNYTGQMRDVKTLSGGEKFNASLCLALGMADVIQAYEGGISIETMFIDEGFGSLDEESLNKAIDTLIDLQKSGRMIGVISHVQELKQAIPAILEVKKTKEGYSQTEFVIR